MARGSSLEFRVQGSPLARAPRRPSWEQQQLTLSQRRGPCGADSRGTTLERVLPVSKVSCALHGRPASEHSTARGVLRGQHQAPPPQSNRTQTQTTDCSSGPNWPGKGCFGSVLGVSGPVGGDRAPVRRDQVVGSQRQQRRHRLPARRTRETPSSITDRAKQRRDRTGVRVFCAGKAQTCARFLRRKSAPCALP